MHDSGWKQSYVKCVHCGNYWVSVRPWDCHDEDLECPECHKQGAAVMSPLIVPDRKVTLQHLWN